MDKSIVTVISESVKASKIMTFTPMCHSVQNFFFLSFIFWCGSETKVYEEGTFSDTKKKFVASQEANKHYLGRK